ncbi:MAG: hypothetical protein ACRD04_04990, partial [Terriglobales bacterium]
MSNWFWHGLRHRIVTTPFPRRPESSPGAFPWQPCASDFASPEEAARAAAVCPTGALRASGCRAEVELGTCIACQRCRAPAAPAMRWERG